MAIPSITIKYGTWDEAFIVAGKWLCMATRSGQASKNERMYPAFARVWPVHQYATSSEQEYRPVVEFYETSIDGSEPKWRRLYLSRTDCAEAVEWYDVNVINADADKYCNPWH